MKQTIVVGISMLLEIELIYSIKIINFKIKLNIYY